MSLKLKQGQTWKCGEKFIRIVKLERLEVGYKSAASPNLTGGSHHQTSKKDFCRMLKGGTLITPKSPEKNSAAPEVHSEI
jgi:hypothetical protein